MALAVFNERSFLADLQAAIRASADFAWLDDEQVILLDREPEEGDVVTLYPPALIIIPGSFEPDYGLGGVCRVAYPARFLCIAETLDSSDDSDRWMDSTAGGAWIRTKTLDALSKLGPRGDGAITLTGGGFVNYIEPGPHAPPMRMQIAENGLDLSVPELVVIYDLEVG